MATTVNTSKHEPKATDLDYYSQPENYTGANLQAFQRFISDKSKEENANKTSAKKSIVKDTKYYFFQRYRNVLNNVIFLDELIEREHDDDEEEEHDKHGDTIALATYDTMQKTTEGFTAIPGDSKSALTDKMLLVAASPGESILDRNTSPDSSNLGIPAVKKKSVILSQSPSCRQSDAARKAAFDKMAKEQRAQQARALFRKVANHVRAMCIISSPTRNKAPGRGGGTFMDIASSVETSSEGMKNAGLSFDVKYYKANREINLSSECKSILTMDPSLREPEMIQTVMFGLQSLKSYAEYPLHMQEKLAKVAWYAVVAPKRMIIRQGHYAENFYFILSGHAVVTILLKDKAGVPYVKTATVMKKGMSFGELALLHHSKRTATVTTQDTVQLLSIGREDFFDIFMSGEGEDHMPSHIRYISHLDFMKDWPIEMLVDSPQHCLLHFYKRNTIIVSNSNNSEWLYVVRSGSCVILKKLKGVIPRHFMSKPKTSDLELLPDPLQAIVFDSKVKTGQRTRNRKKRPLDEKSENFTGSDGKHGCHRRKNLSPARKRTYCSKSLARLKNYKHLQDSVPKVNKESPEPVFVQVKILKQKDVFGLDTVVFEEDVQRTNTTFTLVSRGAECIMLSKAYYAKHANAKVKRWIRESIRPYPDEDVFQENLQIKEDWMLYKKTMLDDITNRVKENVHRLDAK